MDKKKKTKLGKIKDSQLDALAECLHSFIAYTALSMYHAIERYYDENSPIDIKLQEYEIIQKILSTSNTLYEDLNDKQKELLREEALELLKESKLI